MLGSSAVKYAFLPIICSSSGGILVSTFVYRNQFLNDESLFSYLVVKSSADHSVNTFWGPKCNFVFTSGTSGNNLDKRCDFFQIDDFEAYKQINLDSIIGKTQLASKIVKDKYYKIRIKKDTLKVVDLDKAASVSVSSIGSFPKDASFSPLFLIEEGKAVGKFEYFSSEHLEHLEHPEHLEHLEHLEHPEHLKYLYKYTKSSFTVKTDQPPVVNVSVDKVFVLDPRMGILECGFFQKT